MKSVVVDGQGVGRNMVQPHYKLDDIKVDIDTILREQFLGLPSDAEAGRLVRRSFFLRKELEPLINDLVQDPRTDYESFDDLVRHSVYALLAAYVGAGYPNAALGEELAYVRSLRSQAYRARRRAEIRDNFHQYDDELEAAVKNGDWEYISKHLGWLEAVLKGAPSEGQRQEIRIALVQSLSLHRAINAQVRFPLLLSEVASQAERWRAAMEDWMGQGVA